MVAKTTINDEVEGPCTTLYQRTLQGSFLQPKWFCLLPYGQDAKPYSHQGQLMLITSTVHTKGNNTILTAQ